MEKSIETSINLRHVQRHDTTIATIHGLRKWMGADLNLLNFNSQRLKYIFLQHSPRNFQSNIDFE
jgi:hypothetical protein